MQAVQHESKISIARFIDEITANINTLNTLNLPVNTFEIILIHYLAQKLDKYTRRLWKESLSEERFPNFNNFINFLNARRQLLQNLDSETTSMNKINVCDKSHYRKSIKTVNAAKATFHSHLGYNLCQLCKGKHRIIACPQFITLNIHERKNIILKNKLCLNCFRAGHDSAHYLSKFSCRTCVKHHHTMIHTSNKPESSSNNPCSLKLQTNKSILLSTAVCMTTDRAGRKHPVRILLDSGSQANFCTMDFARRMGLKLIKSQLPITGINNSLSQADFSTRVRLQSRYKKFGLNIHCAVLPSITNNLPAESFDVASLNLPKGIFLADPQLNFSSQIDLLLGAQYYFQLIEPTKFIRGPHFPIIQ